MLFTKLKKYASLFNMDQRVLKEIGLTEPQAKAYILLVKQGEIKPPDVASKINVTRSNAYKIFEQLEELKLAKQVEQGKFLAYRAQHPLALERLAETKRKEAMQHEQQVKAAMPALLNDFFTFSEQPTVRFYQGEAELKDIYFDQIRTKQPIYIIRPDYNMDIYDFDYMTKIRHLARKAGIQRYAITPDRDMAPKNYKESDPFMLLKRTWLKADEYTAPVEWNAYGDKLAIMSFGQEAIGTIIESPQIAESFRQLYKLLDTGLRSRPGYDKMPLKASFLGATKESQ